MKRAKKIFVGNYKGGVGKTTSIYQIALHMVELGKRVLLIDLDPQCSLSEICIARNGKRLEQLHQTECLNYVYDMWLQYKRFPSLPFAVEKKELVKVTPEHVHFIPSNMFYHNGGLDEMALQLKEELEDLAPLQQFFGVSSIENDFDYILLDCPPSNNMITQGAFLLSDYYIIPTIMQALSIRGIAHYISTVDKIYKKVCIDSEHALIFQSLFGQKPKLLGIFETLKRGMVNNREVINELNGDLENLGVETLLSSGNDKKYLFDTVIQNYEDIARKTALGERCEVYAKLTDEIFVCLETKKVVFKGII